MSSTIDHIPSDIECQNCGEINEVTALREQYTHTRAVDYYLQPYEDHYIQCGERLSYDDII